MGFIEGVLITSAVGMTTTMLAFLWGFWRGVNEMDDVANWGVGWSNGYYNGYDSGYWAAKSGKGYANIMPYESDLQPAQDELGPMDGDEVTETLENTWAKE